MPRNRIIYQAEGLFTGPTGALASGQSLSQIQRVQTVNHTDSVTRLNVLEFGRLSQLDRVIVQQPTFTLNFENLLVDAINAFTLGFVTDGSVSCISNFLSGINDTKSYYIAIAPEGSDLIGTTGAGAFGFGNGFISNATFRASVGQFATEAYTVEALNYRIYDISSGNIPTVDPTTGLNVSGINFVIPVATTGSANSVSALRHGDITATLSDTLGFATSNLHIQSFDVAVPVNRENILQLGNRFAYAKVITFPVTVTATFNCLAGDIAAGNFADKICNDNPINLALILRQPSCSGNGTVAIRFDLKQVKLDSTTYSSNIGGNATVDFSYSTLIGGPQDTTVGLFISGISS